MHWSRWWVLATLFVAWGCGPEKTEASKICVSREGHKIPCELQDLTQRPTQPVDVEVEPQEPTLMARFQAWLSARSERQSLEERLDASDCEEVSQRWAELEAYGPACQSAQDCAWAVYLPLTCGDPVHTSVLGRGADLKRLDHLLECGRPLPKCFPVQERMVLACDAGRCVAQDKPTQPIVAAVESDAEAQARLERVRRYELEARAGATTCEEIAQAYGSLGPKGPRCEFARECTWAHYPPLSCGTPIHTRRVERAEALEALDVLLKCPRPTRICESNRDELVLTCQNERCVPVHKDAVPPPEVPKRQLELQRMTGVETCDGLDIHFRAIRRHGPRCKRDSECAYYEGEIPVCGVALHVDVIPRAEALDALDAYLNCPRVKVRCRYGRDDYDITCDEGQCQKVRHPKAR